jgi:hypothetical protein
MISVLKEESDKHINNVRQSTQDLNKKVSNTNEKFSKEIEVPEKKEVLEMKRSIHQIKTQ